MDSQLCNPSRPGTRSRRPSH